MDFKERLDLYMEGGMINENDLNDINAIIEMFNDKYHIELSEENAGTFIAHLCAAFNRERTGEEIEAVGEDIINEIKALDTYETSLKMVDDVSEVSHNRLNDLEKEYALLHINNLLALVGIK